MHDEKGSDFKVLAVPVGDPRYAHVRTLADIGDHWLREIETFFATYKLLEPKQTEVLGWHDLEETLQDSCQVPRAVSRSPRRAVVTMPRSRIVSRLGFTGSAARHR